MISNKAKSLSSAGHITQSFKAGTEGQQRFYDSCRALNKDIKKTSKADDIGKRLTKLITEEVQEGSDEYNAFKNSLNLENSKATGSVDDDPTLYDQ